MRQCLDREEFSRKLLSQILHTNGRSPLCVRRWRLRLFLREKHRPHSPHWKLVPPTRRRGGEREEGVGDRRGAKDDGGEVEVDEGAMAIRLVEGCMPAAVIKVLADEARVGDARAIVGQVVEPIGVTPVAMTRQEPTGVAPPAATIVDGQVVGGVAFLVVALVVVPRVGVGVVKDIALSVVGLVVAIAGDEAGVEVLVVRDMALTVAALVGVAPTDETIVVVVVAGVLRRDIASPMVEPIEVAPAVAVVVAGVVKAIALPVVELLGTAPVGVARDTALPTIAPTAAISGDKAVVVGVTGRDIVLPVVVGIQ